MLSLIKFYYKFIKKQKLIFSFAFLVILASWLLELIVSPYMYKIFVDRITIAEKNPTLIYLFLPLGLIFASKVLGNILDRAYDLSWTIFISKLKKDMRDYLFVYIQDHSYNFFSNNMSASISQRILDVTDQAEDIISVFLPMFFPLLVSMIITIFLTAKTSYLLSMLFVLWFITIIILSMIFSPRGLEASKKASKSFSKLAGAINDSISNYINIKIFSSPLKEKKYLDEFSEDYLKREREALTKTFKIKAILNINSSLYFVFFFLLLMYLYTKGKVTIGDFMLVFNLYSSFDSSISWLSLSIAKGVRDVGISKGHLNFLLQPYNIVNSPNAKELEIIKGTINYKNVVFSHGNFTLFRNLNINVEPRHRIGIVGASGAGKTTFIKLLMRFYDLNEGTIEIDGQNIKDLTQESLRKNISYVTQEPMLFNRSVLDNIRYAKEDATIEEIKEAARKANCDFIEELEEGYETIVGERGSKLSGGQKQRIAIARAILKNAPILILDEATSALDSETEMMIQKSLERLMENKTVIAIAHRLSTISSLDRLIVLSEGKIIEDGTHSELLERKGYYYRLWNMQTNGFLPENLEETK